MASLYLKFFDFLLSRLDLIVVDELYSYRNPGSEKIIFAHEENILPMLLANSQIGFRCAAVLHSETFKANFQLILEITRNSPAVMIFEIVNNKKEEAFLEMLAMYNPKNFHARAVFDSELFRKIFSLAEAKTREGKTSILALEFACHPNKKITLREGIIQG
jgi:hypothetical protein